MEKNILNTKVVKELFNEDQIKYLKDLQDSNSQDSFIESYNGRISKGISVDYLREDIIERIYSVVQDSSGEKFIATDWGFAKYENKYGKPTLHPHIDGNKTELLIDYQLDSNTEWPIRIGEESYILENNDAAIFSSSSVPHWRPKKDFDDKEFVNMIFFHFVSKVFFDKSNEDQIKDIAERSNRKKSIFEEYQKEWENG